MNLHWNCSILSYWPQTLEGRGLDITSLALTDAYIVFNQVGVCCVYTLFVVVTLKSVIDVHLQDNLSIHVYLLLMIVPLLLINSLRNLKLLVPFSFVANAVTFITIGVVFYYIFETPLPSLSERPVFDRIHRFPLAYGTTLYSFTSVAVVMTIENNMKTPKNFGGWFGIYNRSLLLLMTVTIAVAFLGYWKFGEDTRPSIALNFPPTAILTQVVNLLFCSVIFVSFGLNAYVPFKLIWETYLSKQLKSSSCLIAWEYLLRFIIVGTAVFFAATIPLLGLFVSVFSAISLSHLLFIFPGLLDICSRYPDNYGRFKIHKVRSICFILYGIIGLITGVSVGMWKIVLEFGKMYTKPVL